MEVNLIDYTGMGHPDCHRAARLLVYTKNTRLEQGEDTRAAIEALTKAELEDQLAYIANTIRSSWEFVDYTFEIIGVTRAFTHQFVRTRTASYAQQSQRAIDMSEFTTERPESIRPDTREWEIWERVMEEIRDSYGELTFRGVSAQNARGILPTNIHTNIIAKMNLRTLADLLAKRKNLRAQGEYAEVAQKMEERVLAVHPWARDFLAPDRTATPHLDAILKDALGERSPTDVPEISNALKELDKLKGVWG